ncbi:NAD(P)-dependent oxidoreductase [Paenibacillus sp. N1-5-1-14]|uniref:NAD-dependent epimerase/dehydratase family protein n=1 Tax=Paenibacillus radicibacter TaxID=2972488 RepID=UPI0021599AC6|nr:NAD(P)-dependent oxidoreductase [Paenibacillus radicibacter]MCR8645192.1 NAD(P)-dependent oxidoreductase [Paenibacillus radicibacter]
MTGKILITGANGFTGQHACKHFAAIGMDVAAVYRSASKPRSEGNWYACDLTNLQEVYQLIDQVKPQYILHLAGRNSVPESWKAPILYIESNVLSTMNLMQALRAYPECRTLVVGSVMNFPITDTPQPQNPYSLSKTLQVVIAQCWGHLFELNLMIAKPANLIGPGSSNGVCGLLAKKIADCEAGIDRTPFRLSSLYEERDYVDVRDAVCAFEKILLYGDNKATYSICSGHMHTLGDIVNVYQELIRPGVLELEVGQSTSHTAPPKPAGSDALHALGWHPQIAFKQSLLDALNHFRNGNNTNG